MSTEKVTYTFYLDNVGTSVEGATPTFETFFDLDASVAEEAPIDLIGDPSLPTIVELSGGFYYFEFDWGVFPGDFYLVKIVCGEASEFADPKQRFIIMKLDRNDNLHNIADTIKTSSDSIVAANNELLGFIKRLLEVEQGTWKIEEEGGVYVLNLYPTRNETGSTPVYETTLDINTPIAKYYLQDENSASTATNPFFRIQNGNITSIS